MRAVQNDFIEIASVYGTREGISYEAWRLVGVPAPILARAGILPS